MAFELLTGRLPFTGETPMAIAYKHIHERVPTPSSFNPAVPESLDGWVASLTESQRELRPESAAEARRDLLAESGSLPPAEPLASLVPDVTVIPAPEPKAPADPAATVTIRGRATEPPSRRRRWWRVALVLLLALVALGSAAWAAWAYLIPHEVDVPTVVGVPVDQAQARLGDAGLVVRMGQGQYSTKVAADHVLRVQPPEGTTLEQGDRVTLVPSLGPRPVPVPDVTGKPLPKAKELLGDAGLHVGTVKKDYDDRADKGLVVGQSVTGEAKAPIGSDVDLVISKGPTPVPVPKVVGLKLSQATAALEAEGFLVSVSEDFSEQVDKGVVISQTPAKGTQYQPGNSVSIVVSKGPPEFAMPSVVGMSRDGAVGRLRSLGLLVDVSIVPGHAGAQVVFQEPPAGTTVRAGDLVHIYVA